MMRALLIVATIAVASQSSAQTIISEEWTTYCDGGTERVRASITIRFHPDVFFHEGESGAGEFNVCDDQDHVMCYAESDGGIRTDLGGGDFRWTWQGWPVTCFESASVHRSGWVLYLVPTGGGDWDPRFLYFNCADGPYTIIDESECAPTLTAVSTWGAIKALYR
jgi:hypothetical protein